MAPDPATDLALLETAADAAGEIALRHFRASPKVWEKPGDEGPVTEADHAIDEMLRTDLLRARPDYGWLSEETADTPDRLTRQRVFVVDPIDGTRSFIDGSTDFAVAMAVVEDGHTIAAVVHLPAREECFCACHGQGARMNGAPLSVSGREDLDGAQVLINKAQLTAQLWPGGVPSVDRHFRPSLAWRLCLVAKGRFDALVTLRDAWEWDIAAGALIAAEAGAAVSDGQGEGLRFNRPNARSPGIIAATPQIHTSLIARRSAGIRQPASPH